MRAEDISIVVNQVDPYLFKTVVKKSYDEASGGMQNVNRDVIVDDGALPGNDPMMTGSQVSTAQLLKGIPGNDSSEAYWMEYGRRIHEKFEDGQPIGIRCDSCTALAFYLLRHNGCSGSLSVIEQAKGNANGHWFLLVGCPGDATIGFPDSFPRGSFVVDLWGIGVKRQRKESTSITSVIDPPSCVYSCGDNSLKRKVHHAGLTTVPTMAKFVTDTAVPGVGADKARGTRLKELDAKLDQYHSGAATLDQLATAFTDWVSAKDGRQGDVIDSVRNSQGQMAALRQELRWLGKAV